MPFMALMATPLSAMLSVTGDDGSLGYLSHARARVPPIIYFSVTTCHQGRRDKCWDFAPADDRCGLFASLPHPSVSGSPQERTFGHVPPRKFCAISKKRPHRGRDLRPF